jgi:hypothetical protein
LRSEGYVCANPGKFGVIFDEMYMSNPGISRGSMKVYVIMRGRIQAGQGENMIFQHFYGIFSCMYMSNPGKS